MCHLSVVPLEGCVCMVVAQGLVVGGLVTPNFGVPLVVNVVARGVCDLGHCGYGSLCLLDNEFYYWKGCVSYGSVVVVFQWADGVSRTLCPSLSQPWPWEPQHGGGCGTDVCKPSLFILESV